MAFVIPLPVTCWRLVSNHTDTHKHRHTQTQTHKHTHTHAQTQTHTNTDTHTEAPLLHSQIQPLPPSPCSDAFWPWTLIAPTVLRAVVQDANIAPGDVEDIVVGNVLTDQAALMARVAQLLADIPHTVPVTTINRQCSSGLQVACSTRPPFLRLPARILCLCLCFFFSSADASACGRVLICCAGHHDHRGRNSHGRNRHWHWGRCRVHV